MSIAIPTETHTGSPDETRAVAARLAAGLAPGAVLALYGDLGAGKTCFVQGLAAALDVDQPVSSPTYTLVNEYRGRLPVYHIDLYRLASADDALAFGLDEYLDGDGVTVIEWAERAAAVLPARTVFVELAHGATENQRTVCIRGGGAA
jgi:tRNA threonylcarbamoyladenosine biosynthesis protein TsaE